MESTFKDNFRSLVDSVFYVLKRFNDFNDVIRIYVEYVAENKLNRFTVVRPYVAVLNKLVVNYVHYVAESCVLEVRFKRIESVVFEHCRYEFAYHYVSYARKRVFLRKIVSEVFYVSLESTFKNYIRRSVDSALNSKFELFDYIRYVVCRYVEYVGYDEFHRRAVVQPDFAVFLQAFHEDLRKLSDRSFIEIVGYYARIILFSDLLEDFCHYVYNLRGYKLLKRVFCYYLIYACVFKVRKIVFKAPFVEYYFRNLLYDRLRFSAVLDRFDYTEYIVYGYIEYVRNDKLHFALAVRPYAARFGYVDRKVRDRTDSYISEVFLRYADFIRFRDEIDYKVGYDYRIYMFLKKLFIEVCEFIA